MPYLATLKRTFVCVRVLLVGSFCTSSYVVGTGAFVRAAAGAESGTYAQFYASGVNNGARATGISLAARSTTPPAPLLSRTERIRHPNGTLFTDALRVNGAAVKPRCQ